MHDKSTPADTPISMPFLTPVNGGSENVYYDGLMEMETRVVAMDPIASMTHPLKKGP